MALRAIVAAALLGSAMARTDLAGCTYTDTVVRPTNGGSAYGLRVWYVPGTGEYCDLLDCGGGRAPPKTNVPGCPLYSGTATYSPSFMVLPGQATSTQAVTTTAAGSTHTTVFSTATATETATATGTAETSTGAVSETESGVATSTETNTASHSTGTTGGSATKTAETTFATTPKTTLAPSGTGAGKANTTSIHTSVPTGGAAPTAAAVFGSCLIAGVVACMGML